MIVAAYAAVDDREVANCHVPKIVLVDAANRIKVVKTTKARASRWER